MDKDKGFTLLELIIVMFLIGLTLSLAAVLFSNSLPSSKFSATTREITASIRHARTLAQLRGEKQTFTIDMEAHKYGIDTVTSRDIPPGISIKVVDPLQGDVLTGKYQFDFPPTGGAQGGTIVLWNSKKTVRIEIDPIVGAAVVK
jgi:general secretion pathway protein H